MARGRGCSRPSRMHALAVRVRGCVPGYDANGAGRGGRAGDVCTRLGSDLISQSSASHYHSRVFTDPLRACTEGTTPRTRRFYEDSGDKNQRSQYLVRSSASQEHPRRDGADLPPSSCKPLTHSFKDGSEDPARELVILRALARKAGAGSQ